MESKPSAQVIPLHRGARIVGSFDEAIQGNSVHLPELALLGSRRSLPPEGAANLRIVPVDYERRYRMVEPLYPSSEPTKSEYRFIIMGALGALSWVAIFFAARWF